MRGARPHVNAKNKAAVVSLREIARGRVHFHRETNDVVLEYINELSAATRQ